MSGGSRKPLDPAKPGWQGPCWANQPVSRQALADCPPAEIAPTSFDAPLRLAAAYDSLRLSCYRDNGSRGHLISIASIGSATVLRFEDVGYFNRVYAAGDIVDRLEPIERFFRGSPHGCRLLAPALSTTGTLAGACASRGWSPEEEYAWLMCTDPAPRSSGSGDFEIRPPGVDEQELFLQTYLAGFASDPERRSMALENMRHLFSVRDLYFLFAFRARRPAGIGMLYRCGDSALLCAGATLASHRGLGCHEALLAARIRLARKLGCTRVHSWALAGGQSQANMERIGLRTVCTSRIWRFPPSLV